MDRSEAAVKVSEDLGVIGGDVFPNFLALESPGGGQDGDLRHDIQDVKGTPFIDVVHLENPEMVLFFHELRNFVLDHGDVGTEVLGPETKLHKLLLFHEAFIRAVVHDVLAKDGSGQGL